MTIGEKLKQLRIHRGLTQEQMADAISKKLQVRISRDVWAKWESDGNPVSLEYAKQLATFFGITLDELAYENRRIEMLHRPPRKTNAVLRSLD